MQVSNVQYGSYYYGSVAAAGASSSSSSSNSANVAQTTSTEQSATAPTAANSVQLDTQTLVALLNAQEGSFGATQSSFVPSSPADIPPAEFINPATAPTGSFGIVSSAGALTSSEMQGQSASSLANDLVDTFGSDGTISLSDVDGALGLNDSTDPPEVIQQMRSEMASAWNSLSGGASTMSADQLASAIGGLLPVTS